MASLSLSSVISSRPSQASLKNYISAPASPATLSARTSPSSSKYSLGAEDDENVTITVRGGFQKSEELDDIRLLAISTHMTELSFAISDIQARIFEIQELRHRSQSSGDSSNTTSTIDQSLITMDEKLESVEKGIKSVNDALDPLLKASATPTMLESGEPDDRTAILRKHAALLSDWEAVQKETKVLREELKEDKWLTVFRTVTDQADGMMSSLEKAVNRCQDFIWQVHRRGIGGMDDSFADTLSPDRNGRKALTFETFTALLDSYEAKKKHYMPATTKVLAIIDKGVQERVTKNGETLRRHAESAQRWRNLRERITRTDAEMEGVRKIFLGADGASSDAGSSASGHMSSKNGYLVTPPSGSRGSRAPSVASTISESISPFRMFARKISSTTRSSFATPLTNTKNKISRTPSSEPVPTATKAQRASLFSSVRREPKEPTTPQRPSHKHTQSLTPEASPKGILKVDSSKVKSNRPSWNSSTKVEPEDRMRTIRATPPRRSPSATGTYRDMPSVPTTGTPFRRSLSRASMASSRPWSPVTSSISTSLSGFQAPPPPPLPTFRPPSRAQTPSRAVTPLMPTTPRPRPRTPSHIPIPKGVRSVSTSAVEGLPNEYDGPLSPTFSAPGSSMLAPHPPRPPSRSMIPIPSLHLSTPSRPSTSLSSYMPPESPTTNMFRSTTRRSQTPDHRTLRARPLFSSVSSGGGTRPPMPRMPPSSFRDGSVAGSGGVPSRPSSRAGAHTPTTAMLIDSWTQGGAREAPVYEYTPVSTKDPLELEVASVLNSLGHGFLVERVDPPLKKVPKEGEEVSAKYKFSTTLGSKTVTLKLTTMNRKGGAGGSVMVKKVMCRVGGGWQDLSDYVLNRQL